MMHYVATIAGFAIASILLAACSPEGGDRAASELAEKVRESPCAAAFAEAASVGEYQDTHEDLFPAYSACHSLDEWRAADRAHPAAIDGVDPVRYAMTVCAGNQAVLGDTPICKAVNEPAPVATGGLERSGETGLLNAPLPSGARVTETTAGDAAAGRDPSQRYSLSASASEIAAFYNREMSKDGWVKDGASTDAALFFQKEALMIGVLINSSGGTFTLMGS